MKTKLLVTVCIVILSVSCYSNDKKGLATIVSSINGGPVIPYSANTLYIAPFGNSTNIHNYGEKIKQRIAEKIIAGGRLAIAPEKVNCDITLIGRIESFQIQPIIIDRAGIIKKKRLLIIAVVSLINEHSNSYIFRNMQVQAFKEFSDIEAPVTPLAIVQDEVEQVLASRIALQVETGWYTSLKSESEKGKRKE